MKRLAALLSTLLITAGLSMQTTQVFAASPNLVPNPGMETAAGSVPASWSNNKWGTNSAVFTYDMTGRSGNRAATVKVSEYSSGDAKWLFNPVTVAPNTTYTFSNWYKSTAASGVVAAVTPTVGAVSYVWLANTPISAAWKQQSLSFKAPADAKQVTFYHYLDRNGSLSIDDYSLTANDSISTPPPTPPAAGNLVTNASVETANGAVPTGWVSNSWGTNSANLTYESNGQDGTRSVRATISSYTSGDAKWYFTPVAVTPGNTYSYSQWYKSNVETAVNAMVTMTDGSTQYFWLGTVPANPATWQKINYQFTPPANAAKATIFHVIAKAGYVQVDTVSLSQNSVVSSQFSRGLVSLSFDDGWRSIHANGLPLLKKYGLVSTQYLNSEPIIGGYPDYMTYQMVKDFTAAGHELGWHTRSHVDITTLTAANLNTELTIPPAFLTGTEQSASAFKHFASPYGSYNPASIASVMSKYQSHRSTDVGYNSKANFDGKNIKVQNVTNITTPADVQSWVNQALATKTWLVIVYHEVTPTAADPTYAVTPTNLDAELNIIKQSGVTVKTLDQAFVEISSQL